MKTKLDAAISVVLNESIFSIYDHQDAIKHTSGGLLDISL